MAPVFCAFLYVRKADIFSFVVIWRCKFSIEKFFSHGCAGAAKSFFVPPSNKVIKKKFFQNVDKAFCNAMKTAKIGG